MDSSAPQVLQDTRERHIGRQLLRASRAFNERALHKLRERGHAHLTPAHLHLLPHLDVQGNRLNTLAQRAELTKQAASQLVNELERHGYVQRTPDPHDRRAVQITFTPAGQRFLLDAQAIKQDIEHEYRTHLGPALWTALQDALLGLDSLPGPSDPA